MVSKRVLIVDDSAFIRAALSEILTDNGYAVVDQGVNGREGVLKFTQLRPDLVTLDVVMPELGGLEALKEIMALDRNAKVLMVTGEGDQATIISAIQLGAKGFVVKPFEVNAVLSEVKRILKG